MKLFYSAASLLAAAMVALPAQAQTSENASLQRAIALYRGHGLTLNFRPTGETVQRAWIDDPSQTTLDFDDSSCMAGDQCAASVIHLRRIHPLDFPGLPSAETTSLTVVTDQNIYSFRLSFPNAGQPSQSVLNIGAQRESPSRLRPRAEQQDLSASLSLITQGLEIAESQNWITRADPLWERVQTFVSLVESGSAPRVAAQQAGISLDLVVRLGEMGQQQSSTLSI